MKKEGGRKNLKPRSHSPSCYGPRRSRTPSGVFGREGPVLKPSPGLRRSKEVPSFRPPSVPVPESDDRGSVQERRTVRVVAVGEGTRRVLLSAKES